jgi:light-regulated signal transduction histidine kinase (bacteriophytochrome)
MDELMNAVRDRLEIEIRTAQASFSQGTLPTIFCDRIKFVELFVNLISNAVKYSSRMDGKKPEVEIGHMEKGKEVIFFVKDNGIGIAPEYHLTIFDMFKRLHSEGEYEGTGIGLYIVKRIVEDHGGDIALGDAENSEGAEVILTFPFAQKKSEKDKKGIDDEQKRIVDRV